MMDEGERLAALREYALVGTPPEERFDRITALASEFFGAPIAIVSLLDEDWQWLKSSHGFDASRTPRAHAFCDYTIRGEDVFEICDTHCDERFAANPLVLQSPHVRYYAGAPLTLRTGQRLGALCILDNRPRQPLKSLERSRLQTLADVVVSEMDLRLGSKRLAIALAAADAANQAKAEFLANMSHELRTPLTSIMGFSGLLRSSPRLDPELHRFAEKTWGAAQHLLAIVNDVLEIARLDAGADAPCRSSISATEIAGEVIAQVADKARAKSLDLSLVAQPDLHRVNTDPARLRQVLLNLLTNAIKFTHDGYITVRLSNASSGDVTIDVSDTGIGIPKERQAEVFERFVQADSSSSRTFGGTGLGLAISKRLVEAMGGELKLQSTPGRGSTFSISLPGAAAGI